MSAFSYIQNFDSLNSATIDGQDSFVTNPSSTANCAIETGTVLQGTKSVECNGSFSSATRAISADSGIFYFMMQCHTAPVSGDGGNIAFILSAGNKYITVIKFIGTSPLKIQYYTSGGYSDLVASASLDTLYWVGIDYDGANSRFKTRIGSGAWSGYVPTGTAGATSMDKFLFSQDSGDSFFDNITLTDPFTATPAKPAFLLNMV